MKNLLLIAIFVVTWRSSTKPEIKIYDLHATNGMSAPIENGLEKHYNNRLEFPKEGYAKDFRDKLLEDSQGNWDVRLWKMEEIK